MLEVISPGFGLVKPLVRENQNITNTSVIFDFVPCQHHVVVKDLCAECGANLRKHGGLSGERSHSASASIPMVHSMPDLHVSESIANKIAQNDEKSLIKMRKLVLLVDLDQTVIHTTTERNAFKFKNVFRYRLANSPIVYHTRLRPHLKNFLERISKLYELHICTFGNRLYAHQLAAIIDPQKKYFAQRILSRDECFNPVTKAANLKALFPRGTKLVCIIDDRGDVWNWPENLILVQPYKYGSF
ncbi:RNA polymerase II [Cichlidogyrus casuarinus]|uniref:RNA polymerase II subunit A C-terminal domain phosphatase n=1 Tax=Cichlidogyrus casuarinus TaxID=1844966 RepID=A0ABD2Q4U7_9PLAT